MWIQEIHYPWIRYLLDASSQIDRICSSQIREIPYPRILDKVSPGYLLVNPGDTLSMRYLRLKVRFTEAAGSTVAADYL